MTWKQAYAMAMEKSEVFRKHDAMVKAAKKECDTTGDWNRARTACQIFSIGDESFYYGFDLDIVRGKHRPNRAAYLINTGQTLVIE